MEKRMHRPVSLALLLLMACQPLATGTPPLGGDGGGGNSADAGVPGPPHCGPYALGERWQAADGCNTCTCLEEGEACTERACPESPCGEREVGEIWDHEDGCNQCACTERGVACTDEFCGGPGRGDVLQACGSDRDCEDGSFCEPIHEAHGGRVGLHDDLQVCLPADCHDGDACPPGFLCDDRGRCRVTHGCDRDEHCSGDEICAVQGDGFAGCWMHPECRRDPCERHCGEDDHCPRGFRCEFGACFSGDPAACERHGQGPNQLMCQPGHRQDAQEDAALCNPTQMMIQCGEDETCEPVRSSLYHEVREDHGVCVGRSCRVLEDCPFQQYCHRGRCSQTIGCHPDPHRICEDATCGPDQFCLESHRQGGGNERCITDRMCALDRDCDDGERCNGLHCVARAPCEDHNDGEHIAGICVPSVNSDFDDHANAPDGVSQQGPQLRPGHPVEAELTPFDIDWFAFTPDGSGRFEFRAERADGHRLEAFCLLAHDVSGDRCESANHEHEWAQCHYETRLQGGQQVFYGVRLFHPERGETIRYRVHLERR